MLMVDVNMAQMKIGDLFPSYEEFQSQLQLYKEVNYVDFYISDSRTLNSAAKVCPHRSKSASEDLKYLYLKLRCVHGGDFKKRKNCTGVRKTKSLRQGCEAFVYVVLSDDGQNLEVKKMSEAHNHKISPILFKSLPKQRKLLPEVDNRVKELMKMSGNKKLIREKVVQETGKIVTLRDLTNIAALDVVSYSARDGLARDLNRLLTTEANSDVDIFVGSDRIRAHSLILSARSPVFADMLQHDMQERQKSTVRIEDFAVSTIQCLLRFIYTGEVPEIKSLSMELLEELYTAADKYAVMELAAMCLQAMEVNFSEENVMHYATLAAKHDKKMMSDAVVRFVADNPHIVHSDVWKELTKMIPTLAEQVLVKRTKRMI